MTFVLAYWKPIASLLLMLGLFAAGWHNGAAHEKEEQQTAMAKMQAEAFQGYRLEVAKNNRLSRELEESRAKSEIIFRDADKKVEKLVGRPMYRNDCLDDDGMRIIFETIDRTATDTAKPDD